MRFQSYLLGLICAAQAYVVVVDGATARHQHQHHRATEQWDVDPSSVMRKGSASAASIERNEQIRHAQSLKQQLLSQHNVTEVTQLMKKIEMFRLSGEDVERETVERKQRIQERKERVREQLKDFKPSIEKMESMNLHELHEFQKQHNLRSSSSSSSSSSQQNNNDHNSTLHGRRTSWFGNGGNGEVYNALTAANLADPSAEWDKWAQAYRMLGAFIDCDHDKGRRRRDRDLGSGDGGGGCSRWMMWASYVNPNYQGYEYNEYFSEEPYSNLDCHRSDTEWQLMGVYRQEFYQFIEQISKHLWAIDDYEYIVARAGLMYMTDDDCFAVGNDNNGNNIYAGVEPLSNGRFQMSLYSDEYCLYADESLGTYDDYVGYSDVDLGSKDAGDGDAEDLYDWWYDSQEYTLTNLNDVYEEFLYCTQCMDYPTYQDGYFIGDYGTDDDDLINQCWKFHSHDSFICEAECIALGHSQGSITQIMYGEKVFGNKYGMSDSSEQYSSKKADALVESSWSRIMANAFLTFSFLLFVATFLAFAVARRSRYRESRSSRSRRLLDDKHDEGMVTNGGRSTSKSKRSSKSKKSKSSRHRSEEADGLFRTPGESGRSRSASRKSKSSRGRSKSGSRKKRSSKSRERSGSKYDDIGSQGERRSSSRGRDNGEVVDNF